MKPALMMFGKTRIPLAASPSVAAAGVELYRALSAPWASDSKPSGAAAHAAIGRVEAMMTIARPTTLTTKPVRFDIAPSPFNLRAQLEGKGFGPGPH